MKKIVSFLLSVVLLLSLVPVLPATQAEAASEASQALTTLSKENSTIAPGITQEIGTVRKKFNNERLVYYQMTIDLSNEYAHIYANYKDNEWEPHMKGQYGFQDVTDQMAAAQRNHSVPGTDRYIPNYTVVGGVNGTGFDMSTGQTRGILIMEHHIVQEDRVNAGSASEPFFGIDEQGKAHIYWNENGDDWKNNKDHLQEAINSFVTPLIKGGKIVCSTSQSDENARTALGIKENGEVVLLVTDGKQKPTSAGCAMYELALLLKEAGCVDAFNMDGGGSTTYVARPEGESDYRILSKPCDGAPRAVSASLVVVSTAPASDEFDHASVAADASYITPGGTVEITATGLNYAGAPVDLPEDVTWELDKPDLGEITGSGEEVVFTASETIPDGDNAVTVTLKYDGKDAGSATVHVVKPNVFSFVSESYALPYETSIDLDFHVAYAEESAEHAVKTHAGDIRVEVSEGGDIATVEGVHLTAKKQAEGDAATITGKLKATLTCSDSVQPVEASLTVGRGTESVQDFEDPSEFGVRDTVDANKRPKSYLITTDRDVDDNIQLTAELVTAEEGHVHSGKYSVRVTLDARNLLINPCGAGGMYPNFGIKLQAPVNDAKDIGVWVWIPDEEVNCSLGAAWVKYPYPQGSGVEYDEGHWFYVNNAESPSGWITIYPYLWTNNDNEDIYKRLANKLVFYVDDVQADYSDVHPDREMPEIGAIQQPLPGDGNKTLERGKVFEYEGTNTVEFVTTVSDPVNLNTTGIDADNIKAYIDGVEIGTTYSAGRVNTAPTELADGVHTLKLYVPDGAGNTTSATRQFRVSSKSELPTVNVAYRTPGVDEHDRVLINSVSYVDVTAPDIANVKKVELDVDLINNALWQLDYAEVDPKFSMEYTLDEYENIATVTLTRTDDWAEGDSATIASLPLKTWGYDWPMTYDKWSGSAWTKPTVSPTEAWTEKGNVPPIQMCIDVDRGVLTYADGKTEATTVFGAENIRKDTELYGPFATVKLENPGKTTWHLHDEHLTNMEDKAATCTTDGWTGRTYCETCKSVVNWGTIQKATGHSYVEENGVRKCETCGALFTGEFGGKLYKNGETVKGWQEDGTYYDDGEMLQGGIYKTADTVGEETVERWHSFDADGKCADKDTGYTGYYAADENGVFQTVQKLPATKEEFAKKTYYYAELGLPRSDWQTGPTDDLTQPSYHTGEDGKVHWVEVEDTRECVKSGHLIYSCTECRDPEDETKPLKTQSELLWWNGHIWDENYECTKCHYHGRDIGKAILNIAGELFDYTGNEIRAAHIVSDNGQWLSVRSDKNGLDGYSSYANNQEIGTATLTIKGVGNYYGVLTGTFKIVPQSVTTITATETAEGEDSSSLTFTWAPAKGAGYYELYRLNEQTNLWVSVARVDDPTTTCTVTGLKMGESYQFKLASRTVGADGKTYYCSTWSNIISGTIEHIWEVDQEQSTDATCTEPGLTVRHCTVPGCGATEKIETDPLGHKVENWETTVEPTYSSAGSRTGECTVCGETVTEEIPRLQYTGTGNSTAPGTTQETVTNPDGSTTTTTTKPDGSTTETTEMVDGTVTEKNTDADGVVTETTTKPDNTVTEKVTQTDGSATERTTTPDGVTGQVNTDAEGEVTSAEVVIPKEAEKQDVVTAPVEVPASKTTEDAPEISVRSESAESRKVEIPVTEFGPGTVAVVVNPDGTEEIVRDCVIGENGVVLNVEGDVTLKIVDNTETFEDVEPVDHWASDAVEFVAARELFKGTGANKFTPNGAMTRGMMVTVLYRLAYEPETVAEQFADVPSGQYYTDAVAWAQNAGVVTGYTDSEFGPNDNVKREQLVTILYRYAKKMGYATTASGTLAGYADASSVSGWAKDAMSWAVELGLVNGVDKTHLAPANNATRAEVATILMRFCEKVVN